jgi:hypothetical protein
MSNRYQFVNGTRTKLQVRDAFHPKAQNCDNLQLAARGFPHPKL